MIASAQTLRKLLPVTPFVEKTVFKGLSFGLSPCGYDIRIANGLTLQPNGFTLAYALEHFNMPNGLLGIVHDKSTWARLGLTVQNTVIEPGWRGFLTLELTNHSTQFIKIHEGVAIAQVVFHLLDEPTDRPYVGKYQDQKMGPVEAILEQ